MENIKSREYALLNEIAQDLMVMQAGLPALCGIVMGSVNWYIKRLISRGCIKVSLLDWTRLMLLRSARPQILFGEPGIVPDMMMAFL